MKPRYCYWSVCDGAYGKAMERCVASARRAGVFRDFHVFTDRAIDGCDCYDAYEIEKRAGLFKVIYLKAGLAKLPFDYFIWIDADTLFARNPDDVLGPLGRSPIHVPLGPGLNGLAGDAPVGRVTAREYISLMVNGGVYNPVYYSTAAFWIVHHDAIEKVVELALHFLGLAGRNGLDIDVSDGLGYAMQMLCANPDAHRQSLRPDLWADGARDGLARAQEERISPEHQDNRGIGQEIQPAIIHLAFGKQLPPTRAAYQLFPANKD